MRTPMNAVSVRTVLAALATLAACGNSSPAPSPSDGGSPPAGWRSVVGGGGMFAQTFDDVSWRARSVAPVTLRSVACVGNLAGWVAGEGGFVAHTNDGGATWREQDAHLASARLFAIRFGTTRAGVVAGERGALAVTADGGATWRTVTALVGATLRAAAVSGDGARMIVAGDGGALLRSNDGGATWTASMVAGGADVRGLAMDSGAHLVLAADANGSTWASFDRGESFARETTAPASLDAIALSDDGARALAVGAHGTALTRDASGTWSVVALPVTADLHAALVAGRFLYAAGEGGTLVGSDDAGATWRTRALGTTAPLYGLEDL